MTTRKAIVALINGCIHIDPVDISRVDMEKIKEEATKALGKPVGVVIAPINEWMPKGGTEALINEVMKSLSPTKQSSQKNIVNFLQQNKNAHKDKKQKHGKRYF